MPIWRHDGTRYSRVPLKNVGEGLDCYLCCPGPSLSSIDPRKLAVPGIFTIALNTAYPYVRPDLWTGMDVPACYDMNLLNESFTKVWSGFYKDEKAGQKLLRQYPATYFADLIDSVHIQDIVAPTTDDSMFLYNRNTFTFALHLALHLGFKKIHLVGCDFGQGKDYHDGRTLSTHLRSMNKRLYAQQVTMLETLSPLLQKQGVSLISCTKDSPVNKKACRFVQFDDAVMESDKTQRPNHLLHSVEAHEHRDVGFMTGCDETQEWMLEWWYSNFVKHHPFSNLVIADFGMSQAGLEKAAKFGTIVKVEGTTRCGWFKKPFAIKSSPFLKTIWLDLDCEVRGSLVEWFDSITAAITVMTPDPWDNESSTSPAYNAGVIGVHYASKMPTAWCNSINNNVVQYKGDQGYMNNCLHGMTTVMQLPRAFNFFFPPYVAKEQAPIEEAMKDTIRVRHYTGPVGKEIIRKLIHDANNYS